jgi:hypothetical protein
MAMPPSEMIKLSTPWSKSSPRGEDVPVRRACKTNYSRRGGSRTKPHLPPIQIVHSLVNKQTNSEQNKNPAWCIKAILTQGAIRGQDREWYIERQKPTQGNLLVEEGLKRSNKQKHIKPSLV